MHALECFLLDQVTAYVQFNDKEKDQNCHRLTFRTSREFRSRYHFFDWAGPFDIEKKANGKKHFCIDFSFGRNASLVGDCDRPPIHEAIFTNLNGGNFFAKLNPAETNLHIELAPESWKLPTFIDAFTNSLGCHLA